MKKLFALTFVTLFVGLTAVSCGSKAETAATDSVAVDTAAVDTTAVDTIAADTAKNVQ
jgi:hypothetical protein